MARKALRLSGAGAGAGAKVGASMKKTRAPLPRSFVRRAVPSRSTARALASRTSAAQAEARIRAARQQAKAYIPRNLTPEVERARAALMNRAGSTKTKLKRVDHAQRVGALGPQKLDPSILANATVEQRARFAKLPRSEQLAALKRHNQQLDDPIIPNKNAAAFLAEDFVPGTLRTIGHTVGSTAEAVYRDPVKQAKRLPGDVQDVLRGAVAALGGSVIAAEELVKEGRSNTAKEFFESAKEDVSRRYGESYRGEEGAFRSQVERQRKEGILPEVADLITLAIPGGAAIKQTAGTAARTAKPGSALQRAGTAITAPRPNLRTSAGGPSAPQRSRGTVQGVAMDRAIDAARRRKQLKLKDNKDLSPHRVALKDGEVAPLLERTTRKAQRKEVARESRRERQRAGLTIGRETRAREGSTRASFAGLTPEQHAAALDAIEFGIPDAEGATIVSLRAAQLEEERARTPLDKTEDAAADELPMLRELAADPRVFDDPAVQAARIAETDRNDRLATAERGIGREQADLTRVQPVAAVLGKSRRIEESPERWTRRMAKELDLEQGLDETPLDFHRRVLEELNTVDPKGKLYPPRVTKTEEVPEFVARIEKDAEELGLVRAGYAPQRFDDVQEGGLTEVGTSPSTAAPRLAAREGEVFRRGLSRKDPEQLVASQESLIRRGERLVATSNVLARQGIRFGTPAEARAFMRANGMSDGKKGDVSLVESPLVRAGLAPLARNGRLHGDFAESDSVWIVPRQVAKELEGQRKPLHPALRAAATTMKGTQVAILGASTSWAMFQILADSIGATAAGGLMDAVRAHRVYRELDDAGKDRMDVLIGGNPAHDILLSDADNQLLIMAKAIDTNPLFRPLRGRQNPLTVLLRADAARSRFQRRGVLLAKMEKDARTKNIDGHIAALRSPQARLTEIISKPDKDAVLRLLRDEPAAEAAAVHLEKWMGNWADYTALERSVARPLIPFYGFMRYSLRLTFYTLPVNHPMVAAIIAQIGRLSAEEARDIVGDELPYGLSNAYNADGTMKVDFARASPILNAFTQIDKPGQAVGLLPPLAGIALNQLASENLFLGREYRTGGDSAQKGAEELTGTDRLRIVSRELLNLLAPFRDIEAAGKEQQTDDTLPFSRRPMSSLDPETAASIAEANAERQKDSFLSRYAGRALPLVRPIVRSQDQEIGERATERKTEAKDAAKRRAERRALVVSGDDLTFNRELDWEQTKLKYGLDDLTDAGQVGGSFTPRFGETYSSRYGGGFGTTSAGDKPSGAYGWPPFP